MVFEDFTQKESVVVVFTGDGKGKTSAGLGLMTRGLGAGWRVAFIQFIKSWEVNEHRFIDKVQPVFGDKLVFYKGGKGFYHAKSLSSSASEQEHKQEARKTYEFTYKAAKSGDFQLVICDEINNAVSDGLLTVDDLAQLIANRDPKTSLCLTGRSFPNELIEKADIVTDMTKIKHHFDDKILANEGIDY